MKSTSHGRGPTKRAPQGTLPMQRPTAAPPRLAVLTLAALLAGSATKHLRDPRFFYPVVPRSLARDTNGFLGVLTRRQWVLVSGALEYAAALGLVLPRTRRLAATATTTMFTAFLAGHAAALVQAFGPAGTRRKRVFHALRLPLQAPLIAWAWAVRR